MCGEGDLPGLDLVDPHELVLYRPAASHRADDAEESAAGWCHPLLAGTRLAAGGNPAAGTQQPASQAKSETDAAMAGSAVPTRMNESPTRRS
jgi:hypothetical protein